VRIERRRAPAPGLPAGVVCGTLLAFAAAGLLLWIRFGLPLPLCRFREMTGVACPTCGSTRMARSLLEGDLVAAAGWNPFMFFALACFAVWAVASASLRVLGHPGWRIELAKREWRALQIAFVVALVGSWIYLIWRGV
jgi:hypothetical protein